MKKYFCSFLLQFVLRLCICTRFKHMQRSRCTLLYVFYYKITSTMTYLAVTSCNGRWANFCNRNQPRGNDAYKLSFPRLRNDNPNQIRNPTAFDARLVGTHARYAQTGQTLNADLRPGSSCGHVQQSNMRCMDHQVGFCCSNDGKFVTFIKTAVYTFIICCNYYVRLLKFY